MSEIRVTSVVGENGGDRVGLTTGLTVGPLTGTTGIGATITHQGHAQFAGVCTATSFVGSGANLTGISAGITEFDHYYLTSNWTTSGDALMTSWARVTTSVVASSASPLGSGISHSSGTFTFPSTGKYLVIVNGVFEIVSDDHIYILVKVTQNNSSYVTIATATDGNGGSATRNGSGTAFAFIDVTNTSNVKIRFHADSISSGSNISGPINAYVPVQTDLFFIRIGDT